MEVAIGRVVTDAALAGDLLGNASGALMLLLAVSVVAAIAFVPLRPRAEQGPVDRLLLDAAILTALGVAASYGGLILVRPAGPPAITVVYLALVGVQVAWVWGAVRSPSRGLLLSGVLINVAALPFAVGQMLAEGGAGDVLGLSVLHVAGALLSALLVWPASRERLAHHLATPGLVAGGRAAAISVVGLVVLLGLAGPGHSHIG